MSEIELLTREVRSLRLLLLGTRINAEIRGGEAVPLD